MAVHVDPPASSRPRSAGRVSLRALRRDEGGYSLIELLVAMSMFAVVLTAVLTLWDTASNAGYNESERNTALAEDTAGLDRMVNDLRQAYRINGPATNQVSDWVDILVRTPVGSSAQGNFRIIYDCSKTDPKISSMHACYRYSAPWSPGAAVPNGQAGKPPSGATSTLVIPRVLNGMACSGISTTDCIFTNFTNSQASLYGPTAAVITIRAASRGERQAFNASNYNHDITLRESVYMRQLDFGR